MPERMSEYMPDRMSEYMPKIHPDGMSGTMSELCVRVGLTRRKLFFFGERCSKIKRKRKIKKRLPL